MCFRSFTFFNKNNFLYIRKWTKYSKLCYAVDIIFIISDTSAENKRQLFLIFWKMLPLVPRNERASDNDHLYNYHAEISNIMHNMWSGINESRIWVIQLKFHLYYSTLQWKIINFFANFPRNKKANLRRKWPSTVCIAKIRIAKNTLY